MFVAKDEKTGTRVTSLDEVWISNYDELRALTNFGQLVCPGCAQALRFRVGGHRRPHFAHRSLSDCPLSNQSAEVLEAKAQLYEWLCTKYPGKVDLDVDLHVPNWDRTSDLVVVPDDAKVFAYWVFDHTPRDRSPLVQYVSRNPTAHVLYTASARKLSDEGDALLLAAAQRDFIRRSRFDAQDDLGHLCFLDTEHRQVLIYRGLERIHSPNRYGWDVGHEQSWTATKIAPKTGEIVADGETARKENPYMAGAERPRPFTTHPASDPPAPIPPTPHTLASQADQPIREPVQTFKSRPDNATPVWNNAPLTCTVCGKVTSDYPSCKPGEGTCVCFDCHPQYVREQYKLACQKIREP